VLGSKVRDKIPWPEIPASHIKVLKSTHILRRMLEFSVSCDFNISGRKHSFRLKFSKTYPEIDLSEGKISGRNTIVRFIRIYHVIG